MITQSYLYREGLFFAKVFFLKSVIIARDSYVSLMQSSWKILLVIFVLKTANNENAKVALLTIRLCDNNMTHINNIMRDSHQLHM